MREMIAAGTYYERAETLLLQEIEAAYRHERGPGALFTEQQDGHVQAIIVPNSPLQHCGACAAWAYKELAETPTPDLYIVISANHHTSESGVTTETFLTPLGMVRVDQDFARELVKKGTVSYDDEIHNREHGIEVQLPWLQHAKRKEEGKLKILPLIVSSDVDLKQLALDIKETLLEQDKNTIFIISSDFLRHGPLFHYVKFIDDGKVDVQKKIYEFDAHGIDLIKALNAVGFYNYVDKSLAPIDGTLAITLLLRILKSGNVRLEQYYTSADILNERKNSVGYAAIVIDKE